MKATPEQQKAGMDAWMAWGKKAASTIVDMGAPLGKSLRVTPGGASPTKNDLGGYSILQAESKEALADTMKGHPHFMMPDGFVEIVLEGARVHVAKGARKMTDADVRTYLFAGDEAGADGDPDVGRGRDRLAPGHG